MDTENPIITCTQMQLAFVAWQIKRRGVHDFDTTTLDLDIGGGSESSLAFLAWWRRPNALAATSLRDLCWQAWRDAQRLNEPNHGDLHHFERWWQTVIDAQPVVRP